MAIKTYPFDPSEALSSEEDIAEYLSQVLEEGDQDEILRALGYVAKARGMTQIAEATGLGRESLYKALRPGAKPSFATISKVLAALGVRITVAMSHASAQPVNKAVAKVRKAKRVGGSRKVA
ncbi:addiction module antidote protein [Dyella choica]|uniref:Putative addiction module antidote protein n=1 Tax=Dyella choica TaxID=1927959 RepID=A0A3S0PJP5_9GAMM|nr:putative addiction module antidote protein [Dyella choica]